MSVSELKEDIKLLKAKLEENLELLKQIKEIVANDNEKLEAVAAKIINELKTLIQEKEVLDAIGQQDLKISPLKEEKPSGSGKYSYPNHGVGNAELGSSGNPKALTWPFGKNNV